MGRSKRRLVASIAIAVGFVFIAGQDAMARCDEIYIKVGAGYKFEETDLLKDERTGRTMDIISDPYSARIESGVDCGNVTWGIAHHSQWRTGAPFNDKGELSKTELFIDYKFSWGI